MDVLDFFEQLARHCNEGECEGCDAREFCYTAPRSMTEDLIRQTISRMNHRGDEDIAFLLRKEEKAMCRKNESCEHLGSQDRLSGLEQLLYEISYRREMLYNDGHDATGDATEDSYEIIMPHVLATLLRRTRLILFFSSFIFGFLLGDLISRVFI